MSEEREGAPLRRKRKPPPDWLHLPIGAALYAGVLYGYYTFILLGIGLEVVFWVVYGLTLGEPE